MTENQQGEFVDIARSRRPESLEVDIILEDYVFAVAPKLALQVSSASSRPTSRLKILLIVSVKLNLPFDVLGFKHDFLFHCPHLLQITLYAQKFL
jgi:hypothetical protein